MSEASDFVRKNFGEGDAKRDEGLVTPEDVARFDDIPYGPDETWQRLDVYRPKAAEGRLPVIVSVHGGGWVYGDKERYQFYCMDLARRGFAVVNFTYRLAPEFKFPANIEDTAAVFAWTLKNADRYGFDERHIFAVGDSAGAHNLALFCAVCTNPAYAERFSFHVPEGFVPTAVALNCGKYRMDPGDGDNLTAKLMEDYLPDPENEEALKLLDVTRGVSGRFPPAYVMTAEGDFLRSQAYLLAARLEEVKVPYVFRCYREPSGPLGHVFHLNIRSEAAGRCNDEECGFFKNYI